jgi:polysaccharide biosynthesis protein PslG
VARSARWVTLLALGALLTVALCSCAGSAKRSVPVGFFGTVLGQPAGDPAQVSNAALDGQMALMARSGVESLRVTFTWAAIEPARGVYDWRSTDRIVADAARHGISLLANLVFTPIWASQRPRSQFAYRYAPTDPQLFAAFATQVVERYGPKGTFWKLHSGLNPVPVREWQIWNEQGYDLYWATTPWPTTYTRLLSTAYVAIHHADPGAKVVAGSLVAVPGHTQWEQAADLYAAGAKPYFDVVSVHPFTIDPQSVSRTVDRVRTVVGYVRDVMRRNGDGAKPIIVTELAWPAALGSVPTSRLLGLESTPAGEQQRLAAAYNYLAAHVRQTGVTQTYWYTWASPFDATASGSDVSYRFAGLNRISGGSFSVLPILNTYAQVAARFEGCRKGSDARQCA